MANNIPKTRKDVEKIKKGKHVAWQIIIDHLPYLSILFCLKITINKNPF
jgi:hypothetical protein